MEQLIVCKTNKGRYAVRPVSWVGIWAVDGSLDEDQVSSLAYFMDPEDARGYIEYKNAGIPIEQFTCSARFDEILSRFPQEKPVAFNYAQARDDMWTLIRRLSSWEDGINPNAFDGMGTRMERGND